MDKEEFVLVTIVKYLDDLHQKQPCKFLHSMDKADSVLVTIAKYPDDFL